MTWPPSAEAIVVDLRLPRVLTAMIVGAGLAVAGATFQGLLRNPLADPYVLGHGVRAPRSGRRSPSSSRSAASCCSSSGCSTVLAFVGALLSVTVVYRLSRTGGRSRR